VILLAAGARLAVLSRQSLWSDEIGTLVVAAKPLARAIGFILLFDLHPPVFYGLAHFWQFLGHGEFVVRLLPAVVGLATCAALFGFARRHVSIGAAWLAALLLALSPAHVYFSGEFRPYTLTALLALASCHWLLEAREPRRRAGAWYALAALAGVYTDWLFALVIAAQVAAVLSWHDPADRRAFARWWRIVAYGCLPGLLALAWQLHNRNFAVKLLSGATVTPWSVWRDAWTFGGSPWRTTTLLPALDRLFLADVSLFTAIQWLLALPAAWLLSRGARAAWGTLAGRVTLGWAFFPPLVLSVGSLFTTALEVKYLVVTIPPALLLVAQGVADLRRRRVQAVAVSWLVMLSGAALWQQQTDPRYFRDDWRSVARDLKADLEPGDAVVGTTFELRFYADAPLPERPLLAMSPAEFRDRGWRQTRDETREHVRRLLAEHKRIWFYPSPTPVSPTIEVEAELRAQAYETTPPAYVNRRPRFLLFVRDRARYASFVATFAPDRLDFRTTKPDARLLRGPWLSTAEKWRWATNSSTIWLKRTAGADAASALVYVNTDLYPEGDVTLELWVEGSRVASQTIRSSGVIELRGPLPDAAMSLPAVEIGIRADRAIAPDRTPGVPAVAARTALVGYLANFTNSP
jgi:hypothetical protein